MDNVKNETINRFAIKPVIIINFAFLYPYTSAMISPIMYVNGNKSADDVITIGPILHNLVAVILEISNSTTEAIEIHTK